MIVFGTKKSDAIKAVFFITPLIIFSSYIFSTNIEGSGTFRYLFPLIFFICVGFIFIGITLNNSRQRLFIAFIVIASISMNVLTNFYFLANGIKNTVYASQLPNHNDIELGKFITGQGLRKGYTPFWSANITNYYSKESTNLLPYNCDDGNFRIFYWLISESNLYEDSKTSFILLERNSKPGGTDINNYRCGEAAIKQFGRPDKIMIAPGGSAILIYQFDIISKFYPRNNIDKPI